MPRSFDDDWYMPEFPWVGGQGSVHDLRDAEDPGQRTRLWKLKSTSEAACIAYDKQPKTRQSARKVGFAHRRPR